MATQIEKAEHFKAAHISGDPIILVNIWDAGSARIVDKAGAKAVATGSYSVAEALGFPDGEACPLEAVIGVLERICAVTDLPVSHDLERGYGEMPEHVAASCARIMAAGAVGLNIEDSLDNGAMRNVEEQAERLAAAVSAAGQAVPGAVINARCDSFMVGAFDDSQRALDDVIARVHAYAKSGATCLFVPGLSDIALITTLCQQSPLPVNVMRGAGSADISALRAAGVARISHGPNPWRTAMAALKDEAEAIYDRASSA